MKTAKEILEMIEAGENSLVEFKSTKFNNDALAKEMVAFSNCGGGTILVGIADDGTIEGFDDSNIETRIMGIARNNVTPSIIPIVTTVRIKRKKIFRVTVEKGRHRPYKVGTTGKFYIRAGSISIEPTNDELLRLFQDGERLHFEVTPVLRAGADNIDRVRFADYYRSVRGIDYDDSDYEKLLYNLQFFDEDGRPTVAGLLIFGANPARFLPQAGIEMARFSGHDAASDILDTRSEASDIISCVKSAVEFVKNCSMAVPVFVDDDTRRVDIHEFEPFVVRELVVNAFSHRDWSISGQRIRLNIFDDRLEIFSPGKLPNTLNLTRALSGVSYYRNPIISQVLRDYGFADKLGRGLLKIMKFYEKKQDGMPEIYRTPEFDCGPEHFMVKVPRLTPDVRHGVTA